MTIHWKTLPKELRSKVSSGAIIRAPNFTQVKGSPRTEIKIRVLKESFIVELTEKAGKYYGTPERFT